jgi:hypothetical protein
MDMAYHEIKLGGGYFKMCYEDGHDDWHIALIIVLRIGYGLSKNCRYKELRSMEHYDAVITRVKGNNS